METDLDRHDEQFVAIVSHRRQARMARVDALPDDLRELVHEYGLCVVDQFMRHGIMKVRVIRHLVETVLDEFSPTRGSKSKQGIRTEIVQHLKNPE